MFQVDAGLPGGFLYPKGSQSKIVTYIYIYIVYSYTHTISVQPLCLGAFGLGDNPRPQVVPVFSFFGGSFFTNHQKGCPFLPNWRSEELLDRRNRVRSCWGGCCRQRDVTGGGICSPADQTGSLASRRYPAPLVDPREESQLSLTLS